MDKTIRPTKKQRELLEFIRGFINEHGYSPSYREIMNGLNYTSVATVAAHVNNLIRRGHLRKRSHSARSIELANDNITVDTGHTSPEEQEKVRWLTKKVADYVKKLEPQPDEEKLHKLAIVVEVLYELGFENIAQHFENKLNDESVEGKKFNSED